MSKKASNPSPPCPPAAPSLENITRYPADADYWLRQALVEQLDLSTKYLIGERDAFYEGCSDDEGVVTSPEDVDALAELDKLIDNSQVILKFAEGK